jgi:hypothetical protein
MFKICKKKIWFYLIENKPYRGHSETNQCELKEKNMKMHINLSPS